MKHARLATVGLWGGAVVLIALAYGPGLDVPGRALREALLPPLALVLAAAAALRGGRPDRRLALLLGGATLATLLGVLLAPGPERFMVARDAIVSIAPWLACLAAAAWPEEDGGIDDALGVGATLALAVAATVGLAQAWTGWDGIVQVAPPASVFVNRNVAAQVVVVLLPLVAAASVRSVRSGRSVLPGMTLFAVAAGVTFLLATRARGAWIAAAAGAVAATVVLIRAGALRSPRSVAWKPVALVAVVTLAASLIPVDRGGGRMPTVGSTLATLAEPASGSGGVRLALWANSAALSGSRVFLGHGAGRFPVVYPLYHSAVRPTPDFGTEYQPSHAHNDWLEYAVEIGWPAALALLATVLAGIGFSLAGAGPGVAEGTSPTPVALRAARAATLTGGFVHGLLSFPLHAPVGALIVWTVAGRAWAGREPPIAGAPPHRKAIAVVAFGLAAAAAVLGAAELSTRAALGRAVRSVQAGDCAAARDPARAVAGSRVASRLVRGTAAMLLFDCDPDEAAALVTLERALEVHPHHLNLLLAVGSRRMKAGRYEDAERAYRTAAELVPEQGRGWAGLAMVQALQGNRDAAGESCAAALRIEPDLAAARAFCEANGLVPTAP